MTVEKDESWLAFHESILPDRKSNPVPLAVHRLLYAARNFGRFVYARKHVQQRYHTTAADVPRVHTVL